MAVDFDGLVLKTAMNTFALPVTVTPASGAPFAGRGVWRYQDMDVLLEDGSSLSSTTITLGIRIAEFGVLPKVGDALAADPPAWAPVQARHYLVDKVRPDGQGGASLVLKAKQPVPVTG